MNVCKYRSVGLDGNKYIKNYFVTSSDCNLNQNWELFLFVLLHS